MVLGKTGAKFTSLAQKMWQNGEEEQGLLCVALSGTRNECG